MSDIAKRLERQASACETMGSPFTATLLREAAADARREPQLTVVLAPLSNCARPGLHLAGALHCLALLGEPALARHYPSTGGDGNARGAWTTARTMLISTPSTFAPLLARIPQTNEPARSMPLLAAFSWLSKRFEMPLRLREIGASAGLNLRFDRYRYDGETWQWGDAGSPLALRNRIVAGRPGNVDARIIVDDRIGCDLNPLDATKEEDRLRLTSFVWPDQAERLERLRNALSIARDFPVRIDAEAFATWLPREGLPRRGALTVVFHTIVEEHLSLSAKSELAATISRLGDGASPEAPFACVRMELDDGRYRTCLQVWPNPTDPMAICESDGHAQGITWAISA
ncbi:MAG TPA: DUF2332 domain-containing protein [Candidatus Cybelea sp.]|nr:DUF2332 domain-containing protein [Candidatus Cybelea sp.]